MGITESTQFHGLKSNEFHYKQIDIKEWTQIPNYSYTQNIDPYYGSNYSIMVSNKKPYQEIQKYELFFNSYEQFKSYEQSYEWRKNQKYLVQPKILKERVNNNMCSTFHEATIILERIPIRACQITDIPIDQGLYLLYCAFMGFRKIYQKTGFFEITLDMICFNKEAMVKVWLNNNLSKNFPEFYLIDQNYTESDFIFKILEICQPLIDFSQIDQKFSQFLRNMLDSHKKIIKNQKQNNLFDSIKPKSVGVSENQNIFIGPEEKVCKYSPGGLKNSINLSKKSYFTNNHQIQLKKIINFDKIIDYFELFLKKHKLVIARQMKSIKDLFKIQKKIQYQDDIKRLSNSKQGNLTKRDQIDEQRKDIPLLNLQNIKNDIRGQENTIKKKKKGVFEKKNTKRTNTDRTIIQGTNKNKNFLNQSEQYPGMSQKPANLVFHDTKIPHPGVSFTYRPIIVNYGSHYYLNSPQHISKSRNNQFERPRDRIKTTMNPHISINIQSQFINRECREHREQPVFMNHYRQKSSSTNFSQNSRDNVQYGFHSPTNLRFSNTFLPFNGIKINENQVFKKKTQHQQVQPLKQTRQRSQTMKSPHFYLATQKQYKIDDEIMQDLSKLNILAEQNMNKID